VARDLKTGRTLYVAVDGLGVLRSLDRGRSWRRSRGLRATNIQAIAASPRPGTAYALAGAGDVLKSSDGGASWHSAWRPGETMLHEGTALAVDPRAPGTVYVGVGGFIIRSSDAGRTWKRVRAGLPKGGSFAQIRGIAVAPGGGVFAAVDAFDGFDRDLGVGVYRLKKGATHWSRLSAGLPHNRNGTLAVLRALAINPRTGTAYVGTNLGLYELAPTRGRGRWTPSAPAFKGHAVRRLGIAADGSRMYAAMPGRVLVFP
jgi:photosystem II stability/assembly factor-like uncharacterized protein